MTPPVSQQFDNETPSCCLCLSLFSVSVLHDGEVLQDICPDTVTALESFHMFSLLSLPIEQIPVRTTIIRSAFVRGLFVNFKAVDFMVSLSGTNSRIEKKEELIQFK